MVPFTPLNNSFIIINDQHCSALWGINLHSAELVSSNSTSFNIGHSKICLSTFDVVAILT